MMVDEKTWPRDLFLRSLDELIEVDSAKYLRLDECLKGLTGNRRGLSVIEVIKDR